jgi:hypothetical protein
MKQFALILLICMTLMFAQPAFGDDIKYALSMFHFNIQYCAGGLEGFVPFGDGLPSWELNAEETEDMIVVESFEPVVDLFLLHPSWSVTLEMQGYFLDVLAERHPNVLNKLRTLANAGGAELVSFHYSDQLFIAYPLEDWRRSVELTQATFAKHNIPLSSTVFCQEGQAGEGLATVMEEYGYYTMVWPTNLWGYQYGDFAAEPYYDFGDIKMITGPKSVNDPGNGVFMTWSFLGDGELLATNDWDPYFPWFFKHDLASVSAYEDILLGLELDNYVIGSVEDYVAALEDAAIPAATPPDLLEGTWQPSSTDGTHKWMGGRGLWFNQERDNYVRTICACAHRELLAAETIAAEAGLNIETEMGEAWRILSLGQVTDATGINPFRGEVEYGISHCAEAMRVARDVIEQSKSELGLTEVAIDTLAETATAGTAPADPPVTSAPIVVDIQSSGREFTETWYELDDDPAIYKVEIEFAAGDFEQHKNLQAIFPGTAGPIEITQALTEGETKLYDRAAFQFDHFYLPLANGLIGLGDGLYLIKDQAYVHLGAEVTPTSPDITFRDETAWPHQAHSWIFYVVEGKTAALDLAEEINLRPTLYR